jgi:hypothetical protein
VPRPHAGVAQRLQPPSSRVSTEPPLLALKRLPG